MRKQASVTSWIAALVVVLAVVAAGVYLARRATQPDSLRDTTATSLSSPAPGVGSTAQPPIEHPIGLAQTGPAGASTAALPALADSDTDVAAALAALMGGDRLHALLVPNQIIARIVATIDALPRHDGLGTFVLPVRTPRQAFLVTTGNGTTVMSAQNAERYAPYMALVENTDPQALVTWYARFYPLFQESYRQLGYPRGYFNDRLLVVIDDLLATPTPAHPAALQTTKSYYTYVDPALESLSTGQKLLLRVGPDHAATIKARLREIRTRLTGQIPPATPRSGGTAR